MRTSLLFIAVCYALAAQASEYFVSPSGSPSNSGTESSPWRTIGYALNNATGGDIITLMPGTYQEAVIVALTGSTAHPTTIRSQRKWEAIIQDSPSHGIYIGDGTINVVIDGIQVKGAAIDGIKVGSFATVRNCWIHHSTSQGISAFGTRGTLLERNLIEHNGTDPMFDHGIYLNGTNSVVRCNVIRWNKCYGCQFYSDAPSSTADCQFYNNLVYGNFNALTVWSPTGQTNYVFNNTLLSDRYVLRVSSGVLCVSNNILLGPSPRRTFDVGDGAVVRADYNLVSSLGRRRGSHDVLADRPGFVNPDQGLFWLSADSPARGMASQVIRPPVDFFGQEQKGMLDAGAFQYHPVLRSDTEVLDPSPAMPDYWLTNVAKPF